MPIRNLNIEFVSHLKMYGYMLSYELIRKDFKISKTVFYEVVKGATYKEVKSKENIVFYEKYKKIKKEPLVVKYKIYNGGNFVNDNSSGIYLIQNIENGKCYVGSSYNIRKRLFWHFNRLDSGGHPNNKLQNSYNKYGRDKFRFIPILNCPTEYNHILEQWVKDKSEYNCGYNIAINCDSPNRGLVLTQQQKDKISNNNKGFKWSEEQKQQLKNRLKSIKEKDPIAFKNSRLNNFNKTIFRGEINGNSKLTDIQRIDIINLISKGEKTKEILKKYPIISDSLIDSVKNGKSWKHLKQA